MRWRPAPMPSWLKKKVMWFFIGMATLATAMGFVALGLPVGKLIYMFPATALLALAGAVWVMFAPEPSREYRK